MNVDEIIHLIKQVSAQQEPTRRTAYGHISSYDDVLHRVRVLFSSIRDEAGNQVLSPWMPLSSVWVGNGFGMEAAPVGNEQCTVEIIESQYGVMVCANLLYNTSSPAPGSLVAGEAILKHKSGSFVKFHANGDIEMNTQGNVIIASAQNVNITAASDVNVTATNAVNITAPSILLGSNGETLLDALTSAAAELYNTHTHSGVMGGDSNTGVPNEIMGADQMTSVVRVG